MRRLRWLPAPVFAGAALWLGRSAPPSGWIGQVLGVAGPTLALELAWSSRRSTPVYRRHLLIFLLVALSGAWQAPGLRPWLACAAGGAKNSMKPPPPAPSSLPPHAPALRPAV